ncbi:integumentary mucin A.1-like [Trichoplusia ni]|uniref:Integumentary mucin A.1-like n=1 Tax=Trichoplusia ni TaxID=7111 RepID=A0A7E5X5A4_TRINI|nr:integumentary mucin A.1-like [Trichoplusia ni]
MQCSLCVFIFIIIAALPVTKQESCPNGTVEECEEKSNLRQKGYRFKTNVNQYEQKKYLVFLQQLEQHGVKIKQKSTETGLFEPLLLADNKKRRTKRRLKTTTTASPEYSYYSADASTESESNSGSEAEPFETKPIITAPSTLPPRHRTKFFDFDQPYPPQPRPTYTTLGRFIYVTQPRATHANRPTVKLTYPTLASTTFTTTRTTTTTTPTTPATTTPIEVEVEDDDSSSSEESIETTTKKKRTKTTRTKKRTRKTTRKRKAPVTTEAQKLYVTTII